MKSKNEKTIATLNHLIETCRDGEHGFKTAAEDAKAPELGRLFRELAGQRGQFVRELQNHVASLGGDVEKRGSVGGSLHRGWIDLKAAIASNEPHAVLAECERGEDAAVEAYRDALDKDLDTQSRAVVMRQFTAIQAAHDRVRQLRDSETYSSTR